MRFGPMWQPPVHRPQRISLWAALALVAILLVGLLLRGWYASANLDPSRFWDEQYSLENVTPILVDRTLEPARGFYPSPVFNLPAALAVAGTQALHELTGDERFRAFDHRYHAAAYMVLRLQQTLYSLCAIWMTFLIGRRLFSEETGVLAAAMVAGAPWHAHAAAVFKPDSLLNFTTLLAFWLSLRLVDRPGIGRALLAGLGIALAMSAKMTGGLIAVPLTVALLMGARSDRRRLGFLALTGAASGLFFVLLNPYWRRYPGYLANLSRDYAMRAGWLGWERHQVPGKTLEFLLAPETLGWALGSLCVVGFVALAIAVLGPSRLSWDRRTELATLIAFPPVYIAAYSLRTAYFKPNNFLPLVPLLVVVGAQLLVAGWRWAAARAPVLDRHLARAAAGALAVGLALVPATLWVYRTMVPHTLYAAEKFLVGEGRSKPRLLYVEEGLAPPPWRRNIRRLARSVVPRLVDVPTDRLDLSDGEIFGTRRLRGRDRDLYQARIDRVGQRHRRTFRPALFELRGPAVLALRHMRLQRAPERRVPLARCGETCWGATPEGLAKATGLVSFVVSVPVDPADGSLVQPVLAVAGRPTALYWVATTGGNSLYHSERVIVGPESELTLEAPELASLEPGLVVYAWRRSRAARDTAPAGQPGSETDRDGDGASATRRR